ncbi:peptidoglycan-binding domain-containing protein [uncultured Paracoccus sp.]|uniref:peptidoglycan-binding domain-containing protein n=1 Tax=uncultured Paracoccus sp. TaxID=189685 RepID=UPI0025EFD054|nr:peptidoglycan-binding domain-containing protein [uncultured Paracoccus sp.]
MRRVLAAAAFSILAVALPIPLHAADQAGEFAIKGAGVQTCASLTRAWTTKSADLKLYAGWIDGYLTGMNQHTDQTFDAAPWQNAGTLLDLVNQMCRQESPDARFIDLFNRLMRDFMPARLAEQSPASAIQRGDNAVVLYDDTVQRIQRRLTEAGFLVGDADGVFDDQVAEALEKFQTSKSLPATGFPDQQTLFMLFVSQAG